MSAPLFVILLVCFASIALADDFKTIDGKEYKNVTVSKQEPDGITVMNKKAGVMVKLYFTELSKEVQERFHYDASKGDAYSAEQTAKLEALRKQQEKAQREKSEEAARQTALAPTPTGTPVQAAESEELSSIRAEAEIREAETRGDYFGAEVARIRAYYEPRRRAAMQAGNTQLENQLHELEKREFNQALGRKILQGK